MFCIFTCVLAIVWASVRPSVRHTAVLCESDAS